MGIKEHFEVYGQDDDEEEYEWTSMPGCCEACQEMDGERRPAGGEYAGGLMPGDIHDNCKCSEHKV